MKRIGQLWPHVIAFDKLLKATKKAARGKRRHAPVARFLERREPECLKLKRELEEKLYRPGEPIHFFIHDPKKRLISAAPFRDRVVHHALIAPLEPVLERPMIYESFACRRGKGTHAALRYAQKQSRKYQHFLKMDIRHFFNSLHHDVVLSILARLVKDRDVLWLFEVIVRTSTQKGLPIGNLTSQWLANLALSQLDHYVKEHLRIPGYVRYMDDFVLFSNNKEQLKHARLDIPRFLHSELRLQVKDKATLLRPSRVGLPFLGWNVFPQLLRIRAENLKRIRRRLKQGRWLYKHGILPELALAQREQSIFEHLKFGDTLRLRRRLSH